MPHEKSFRAIGQSLETLGVVAFVIKINGRNYIVRSDALPDLAQLEHSTNLSEKVWESRASSGRGSRVLRADGSLIYDPSYVSWLDAQGKKTRRKRASAQASGTITFAQLLRTLGSHIDRLEPHAFTISWQKNGVTIDYELSDGQKFTEVLTLKKLRELTMEVRVRRAPRR
jgi:hypothetical protein